MITAEDLRGGTSRPPITPESIETGVDEELSRFYNGRRGVLFVRRPHGSVSMVTVEFDDAEPRRHVARVFGVTTFEPPRLRELADAIRRAQIRSGQAIEP